MKLLEKYKKYSGYYPLCGDGKRALFEAAEKICVDERLVAEVLDFKDKLANISDEPEFRQIERELKGKSAQFGAFLYTLLIENMERIYEEKAIPRDIFNATIYEMSAFINQHYSQFGEWGLSDYEFIGQLLGNTFVLGRLRFEIWNYVSETPPEVLALNLNEGDCFLDVHVPSGGRLNEAECLESFEMAKEFFPKYLNYNFKAFGCETWLFDPILKVLLPPESNILMFQRLFKIYKTYEDFDGLNYIFENITKENIKDAPTDTSLRRLIVKHILSGGIMQCGAGYRLV
jgi:hypothetical protein